MTAFLIVAVAGFKITLWIVVAALAVHGVFDAVHGGLVTNPGVPGWGLHSVLRSMSPRLPFSHRFNALDPESAAEAPAVLDAVP